jgi:hypothetical protein
VDVVVVVVGRVVVVVVVVGRDVVVVVVVVGTVVVVVVVGRDVVVVVVVVVGRDVVVVVVVGRDVVVVVVVVVGRDVVVVVVVVVGRDVDVVVVVGSTTPPQATPLTENAVGEALVELFHEPMKPAFAEAPVAIAPFQASLPTVTFEPDWEYLPPQPWVIVWPLANANVTVHELQASPVFLTVRSPWKPPGHWPSTLYVTSHATAADAGSAGSAARPAVAIAPTASVATLRRLLRLEASLMCLSLHTCRERTSINAHARRATPRKAPGGDRAKVWWPRPARTNEHPESRRRPSCAHGCATAC